MKAKQYNKPTVVDVAALITNDFGDGVPTRDIMVDKKDSGSKRISELHLLFPYGEDVFHEKIPYHTNEGSRKTNRGFVTMKEFYAYIIQQRNDQGTTLLRGGRLFQQYLVDAFTAVEEQRLKMWEDTKRRRARGKELVLAGTFPSTPAQIDDIISAEIPSQLEDPEGYKVVIEFMLHDPCGKDAKHAPCNIEENVQNIFQSHSTKRQ
ncbi:hypothetical protein Tco_1504575 [Tanacetum coccineum]